MDLHVFDRTIQVSCNLLSVLIILSLHGNVASAEQFFEEMMEKDVTPNLATYTVMITMYGKLGKTKKAELIYAHVLKNCKIPKDSHFYNMMLDVYVDAGNLQQMHKILDTMRRNSVTPTITTWNSVLHGYSKLGQIELAESVFERIVSNNLSFTPIKSTEPPADAPVTNAKELEEKSIAYTIMINLYGKNRDLSSVEMLFKQMIENKLKPTEATYNSLIQIYFMAGLSYFFPFRADF